MEDKQNLELAFHERMRQIYEQAKAECDYSANRFIQMVNALPINNSSGTVPQ